MICVFSDGLIEARRNGTSDFCGVETLSAVLADVARDSVHADPASAVFDRLTAQGYDLHQDDCTLLVARALDPAGLRLRLSVAPTHEAVAALSAEIERLLRAEGWPEESASAAQLLAMERGANIVKHAGLSPDQRIEFRLHVSPQSARLLFRDPGREWNFFDRLAQTLRQPVTAHNGRGMRIIQAIARHSDQIRTDGMNVTSYIVDRSYRAEQWPLEGAAR
jgi:anti-sigma regulatory factor (Ser/Thr protein kinase)